MNREKSMTGVIRVARRMAILCWLLWAVPAPCEERQDGQDGPGRTLEDIFYGGEHVETAYEKERLMLDLYLPGQSSGFATILWFHGGGLQRGHKGSKNTVQIAKRFARDGVAVAAVNYRLHPKVSFPAYIEDAASSFAWVHKNISRHGGDPTRIFVSGHSAGGYLTAMLGLDPRYLGEHGLGIDAIAGLIPVSGQMVTHSTVRKERGIAKTKPLIDAAAPSYHVGPDAPPVLAICGSEDLPARAAESLYFVEAMKAAGHKDVEYLEVPGRNHGSVANEIPQDKDLVAHAILNFIKAHPGRTRGRF